MNAHIYLDGLDISVVNWENVTVVAEVVHLKQGKLSIEAPELGWGVVPSLSQSSTAASASASGSGSSTYSEWEFNQEDQLWERYNYTTEGWEYQ